MTSTMSRTGIRTRRPDRSTDAARIELVVVPVPGERDEHTATRMAALRRHLRASGRERWTTSIEADLDRLSIAERRARIADRAVDVVAVVRLADVAVDDPRRIDTARLDARLAPLDRHQRAGAGVMARRTMLMSAGGVGLALALAACGSSSSKTSAAPTTTAAGSSSTSSAVSGATSTAAAATAAATSAVTLAPETTEGPYYLDLDLVRSDVREDRQGVPLTLTITVVDAQGTAIKGAAVDLWHCDAGGLYSGFVAQSTGAGAGGGGGGAGGARPSGGGGTPPSGGGGGTASGYTAGNRTVSQGAKTDNSTFLRGTQVTDDRGTVTFTTVYPGWYTGRTVHIHTLVNVNDTTVHVGQLFFDDTVSDTVFASTAPYSSHTGRDTRNANDSIYQGAAAGGLLALQTSGAGYQSTVRMAVKA